jgi:hypothetical protein
MSLCGRLSGLGAWTIWTLVACALAPRPQTAGVPSATAVTIIYIVRTLRLKEQTPLQHAEAVRSWKLHWAWPRDGKRETLEGAGIPLMEQYKDAGLDMMFNHAQFDDGLDLA